MTPYTGCDGLLQEIASFTALEPIHHGFHILRTISRTDEQRIVGVHNDHVLQAQGDDAYL